MAKKQSNTRTVAGAVADALGVDKAVAELGALDALVKRGRAAAKDAFEGQKANAIKFAQLCHTVAEFETREAAVAFVKGYKSECDDNIEKGGADAKLWETVEGYVSRLNRIVKAAFGVNRRMDDESMQHVSAWPDKEGNTVPYSMKDQDKTLAILSGKGGIHEKLGKLPKGNSGRGVTSDKGGTPIQRRINAAETAPATGSLDLMARVLGVGGKDLTDPKAKQKAASATLTAAIKAAPESELPSIIEATISRMLSSSDNTTKDMGVSFRDAWKMGDRQRMAVKDAPKAKRVVSEK